MEINPKIHQFPGGIRQYQNRFLTEFQREIHLNFHREIQLDVFNRVAFYIFEGIDYENLGAFAQKWSGSEIGF